MLVSFSCVSGRDHRVLDGTERRPASARGDRRERIGQVKNWGKPEGDSPNGGTDYLLARTGDGLTVPAKQGREGRGVKHTKVTIEKRSLTAS
jgi:hypothetical protein